MSKETRRLFFALDLSEEQNAESQQAIIAFKQQLAKMGRPVHDDNLHITLAFLGDADQEAYLALCKGADQVTCPPLSLSTTETGYFDRPSTLWLGIEKNAELNHLARELQNLSARILARPPEHKYVPHVSLLRRAQAPLSSFRLEMPLHIGRFGLFSSVAAENGREPHYQCLNHWTLQH